MREDTDRKNRYFGHFSHNVCKTPKNQRYHGKRSFSVTNDMEKKYPSLQVLMSFCVDIIICES